MPGAGAANASQHLSNTDAGRHVSNPALHQTQDFSLDLTANSLLQSPQSLSLSQHSSPAHSCLQLERCGSLSLSPDDRLGGLRPKGNPRLGQGLQASDFSLSPSSDGGSSSANLSNPSELRGYPHQTSLSQVAARLAASLAGVLDSVSETLSVTAAEEDVQTSLSAPARASHTLLDGAEQASSDAAVRRSDQAGAHRALVSTALPEAALAASGIDSGPGAASASQSGMPLLSEQALASASWVPSAAAAATHFEEAPPGLSLTPVHTRKHTYIHKQCYDTDASTLCLLPSLHVFATISLMHTSALCTVDATLQSKIWVVVCITCCSAST